MRINWLGGKIVIKVTAIVITKIVPKYMLVLLQLAIV
jgi:hypothetical protein